MLALGGATEATVWSNWFPVGVVDPAWPSIPYGRPISNARYHVLDAGFFPCPIGVPGDLYIGGDCLCAGYARRPDLTAQAFLPDPFAALSGLADARLYRTGDRARYRADGNLEFLGRLDQQVKVRGFRIELGEIEVALASHPGVRECVVLAREDVPGDQRLVAYVVPARRRCSARPELLRPSSSRACREYMVPSAFVILEALPLTPNGKLDRKALPAPERGAGRGRLRGARRRGRGVAGGDLVRGPGGGARSDAHDDFFDLGGHSLLATQVVSRIREAFGVELPLRDPVRGADDRGAGRGSRVLPEAAEAGRGSPIVPLPRGRSGSEPPLSFAQQRLWFLDRWSRAAPSYNIPRRCA